MLFFTPLHAHSFGCQGVKAGIHNEISKSKKIVTTRLTFNTVNLKNLPGQAT